MGILESKSYELSVFDELVVLHSYYFLDTFFNYFFVFHVFFIYEYI